MQPIKHPLCNDVLLKPPGMTEEECRDLHIRRDDSAVWSFWQPNPEELLALNRGGAVALIVMGATHPPLSILATHPTEPQESRPVDESEYRHRMEAVNARLIGLTKLLKTALSAWTKNHPDDKDRSKIADQFLDMLNANKTDGSLVETVPADEPAAITQTDLDRYRADAEGWKAEAERLRKLAEKASDYRLAAEGAEHALANLSKAIDPEGVTMSLVDEVAAMKSEIARRIDPAAIREFVQHLDDDRHWLDLRVNCEAWFEQTPEFFYRSGFNAAANAVIVMPDLNPNPSES